MRLLNKASIVLTPAVTNISLAPSHLGAPSSIITSECHYELPEVEACFPVVLHVPFTEVNNML